MTLKKASVYSNVDVDRKSDKRTYLRIKLYASPGGGANMIITETSQCSKRPAKGVLKGLLEAQSLEKGRIPSRPISWTTGSTVSIAEFK